MNPSPHWICAPDSFKGTHTAPAVAEAVAVGLRRDEGGGDVTCCPMADGGEGTLALIAAVRPGVWHDAMVCHARPERGQIPGRWLVLPEDEAMLELATVAGLASLEPAARNPEETSSFGFGQLMAAALEKGPKQMVLAVGGSCTVDGGLGLLQALGARIWINGSLADAPVIGRDMASLTAIDLAPARQRVAGCRLSVAADVRSPLLGQQGAVALYGPQKGASGDALIRLEDGLGRVASLLQDAGGEPGDGAVGGAAFALRVGLGASVMSGAGYCADVLRVPQAATRATGMVTGEGCYDGQTNHGKVAWEIASIAAHAGIPCGLIAGRIERSKDELAADPFAWHVSLEELSRAHPECTSDEERLALAGEQIARAWRETP